MKGKWVTLFLTTSIRLLRELSTMVLHKMSMESVATCISCSVTVEGVGVEAQDRVERFRGRELQIDTDC